MFYESERIISKNNRYVNLRAYTIIQELEKKKLTLEEQIASIEILLEDEKNEFQVDVLNRAKKILNSKEIKDEEDNPHNFIRINSTWAGGTMEFDKSGAVRHNTPDKQ